ncbi:hypothetical protein BCR34DRAFT_580641 [Clohesyomyces aquaticus]|uniref:Uncharacterized protein n=1 Tax=Clohesyomyces aquaticus TaxID=1231657 RepID=A0A1Y1Y5F2_9PLEO|nr:hypothetical protein BCR34DRAFT_580641 [Clohesyomyces aquaticus]
MPGLRARVFEARGYAGRHSEHPLPRYLVLGMSDTRNFVGLASFDNEYVDGSLCCRVAWTSQKYIPIENLEAHNVCEDCIDFVDLITIEVVYFVLLVQPLGDRKYKRVGVAMLYSKVEEPLEL